MKRPTEQPNHLAPKLVPKNFFENLFIHEKIVLGAIILNALIIFVLAFPSLENSAWLKWLYYADSIFVFYFTIEAIIKIKKLSFREYIKASWNRFDFLIVLLSFPLLLENYISITGDNFHIITIFRLFRLLRVIRFFRFDPCPIAFDYPSLCALSASI